jgi:chromosome segregation ATPase
MINVNLNYNKIKNQHEHGGNTWTSYSDLFLVLSVVFLLLFTVANIRSGTMSAAQQTQLVQAKAELDNLKKQIKAYDVLKDDYVKDGASQDELATYHELMSKMDLLTGDAKKERDEANTAAQAANEKAQQLNKYQQLVKNIITANLVASGKVKKRDMMIGEKDNDIDNLDMKVSTQTNQIQKNNEKIASIQDNLAKQIEETKYAYRSKKHSKEAMETAIQKLKDTSEEKISALQQANQTTSAQLDMTKSALQAKSQEAQHLMQDMSAKEQNYQASIANLNQTHDQEVAAEKAAFDKSMNELKLSGDQKLAQERAYAAAQEEKNTQYQSKLAGLNSDLQNTQNGIKDLQGKYQNLAQSHEQLKGYAAEQAAKATQAQKLAGQYANQMGALANNMQGLEKQNNDLKGYAAGAEQKANQYAQQVGALGKQLEGAKNGMAGLENSNKALAGDLAAAQRKLNEQRMLADAIQKNFRKAGIDASVDGKTGDVVINFQGEYFDTGSADLKTGMKSILEKTFPVYAKSLMENKAIASKIGSVEIVGFASPTYKGKSIDPSSLSAESRQAVNYNMDLSYQRAKSIFQHVFDTDVMQFQHQKTLLPLVKVSGRSYLATDKLPGRSTAALSQGADYCSVFDCKKSQRVIIKFNLREE